MIREIKAGDRIEWKRSFTEADVRRFAELSGDKGAHHVSPDGQGRLLVHGLLTATLPTKLGGDMDFLARTMSFEFLRPAYAGTLLTCLGLVERAEPRPGRLKVAFSFAVTDDSGELVMKGKSAGIILTKRDP